MRNLSDELRELTQLATFKQLSPERQRAVLEILSTQYPYRRDGSLNEAYHDAEREALGLKLIYRRDAT